MAKMLQNCKFICSVAVGGGFCLFGLLTKVYTQPSPIDIWLTLQKEMTPFYALLLVYLLRYLGLSLPSKFLPPIFIIINCGILFD